MKNSSTLTPAKKTLLSCGASLISIPSNRLTKVWFGLRFRGGQVFELNPWQTMQQKNSKTTPPQGSFSLLSILLEGSNAILSKKEMVQKTKLNAIEHNSITGECSFGFNLSYLKEKSKEALHIAKAALSLKTIDEKEFKLEQSETLHDIARTVESGEQVANKAFTRLFLANSPFKESVLGTKKTVEELQPLQLEAVWKNFRSPKNCVAVIAGNFTPAMQEEILEMLNHSLQPYSGIEKKKIPKAPHYINRLKKINDRLVKETHSGNKQTFVKLGYALPNFNHKESLTGRVLQSYLSGMGGPLFKLRSEPYSRNGVELGGRAYVMGSRLANAYHYGGLVFYTSLREEAQNEGQWALDSFAKETKKLREKKLSKSKIEEAKNALLAARNLQLGKISFRAGQYATYEILGIPFKRWEDETDLLKNISAEDVLLFCKKYLTSNNSIAHVSQEEKS